MTEAQRRAAGADAILGGLALAAGALQTLFDHLNDKPLGGGARLLLAVGAGLVVLALAVWRLRAAAWLSFAVVLALIALLHYWAITSWDWRGVNLGRVLKLVIFLLFCEGLAIWAVVVQWRAAR
jgi:hypothetical protein